MKMICKKMIYISSLNINYNITCELYRMIADYKYLSFASEINVTPYMMRKKNIKNIIENLSYNIKMEKIIIHEFFNFEKYGIVIESLIDRSLPLLKKIVFYTSQLRNIKFFSILKIIIKKNNLSKISIKNDKQYQSCNSIVELLDYIYHTGQYIVIKSNIPYFSNFFPFINRIGFNFKNVVIDNFNIEKIQKITHNNIKIRFKNISNVVEKKFKIVPFCNYYNVSVCEIFSTVVISSYALNEAILFFEKIILLHHNITKIIFHIITYDNILKITHLANLITKLYGIKSISIYAPYLNSTVMNILSRIENMFILKIYIEGLNVWLNTDKNIFVFLQEIRASKIILKLQNMKPNNFIEKHHIINFVTNNCYIRDIYGICDNSAKSIEKILVSNRNNFFCPYQLKSALSVI